MLAAVMMPQALSRRTKDAAAQEPDARDDLACHLTRVENHLARFEDVVEPVLADQHEQGRAHTHERMGPTESLRTMIGSTGTLVGYWDRRAPPYDTRMATVERRLPGRASICFA